MNCDLCILIYSDMNVWYIEWMIQTTNFFKKQKCIPGLNFNTHSFIYLKKKNMGFKYLPIVLEFYLLCIPGPMQVWNLIQHSLWTSRKPWDSTKDKGHECHLFKCYAMFHIRHPSVGLKSITFNLSHLALVACLGKSPVEGLSVGRVEEKHDGV